MIQKHWWKFLALFILIYVLIASVLTPLKPGITSVYAAPIKAGNNTLIVQAYNTHFAEAAESQQVFYAAVGQDTTILCGNILEIESNTRMRVSFEAPDKLPVARLWVYVHNEIDGTVSIREAANVDPSLIDPSIS
ncbi:MAG: hypothetical protein HKN32_07040, partial [Flavobacteriales bacterium]|nr:hypothetical protein [Flavobacteriales bacterium]